MKGESASERALAAPRFLNPLSPRPSLPRPGARALLNPLSLLSTPSPQGSISVRPLDLADLASVSRFAASVASSAEPRLDVLLNNAGVMACPESRTADGFEMQWGTNHAGHFLLTRELLPKLQATPAPPARVVCVGSIAHATPNSLDLSDLNWRTRPYDRIKAYGASKLCNVLHAKGIAARADPSKVLAFSLHPGVIQTDLFRHVGGAPGTWAGSALAAISGVVRSVGSVLMGRPLMKTVRRGRERCKGVG